MKVSKKQFKPSSKKRIQLTFVNMNVKILSKQKSCLCCSYGPRSESKIILDNVSGTIYPGQFVAILGSSGSGKTTFLNYLSGRTTGLSDAMKMTGKITINGKDRERMPGAEALSCYVQQDDVLFQTLTVRECLTFAAQLKMIGSSYEEKVERVDEIIKDLRLHKC
jgi:ATP-binding cassette, subfamily G (WHITE), eye pigment precursor transporter